MCVVVAVEEFSRLRSTTHNLRQCHECRVHYAAVIYIYRYVHVQIQAFTEARWQTGRYARYGDSAVLFALQRQDKASRWRGKKRRGKKAMPRIPQWEWEIVDRLGASHVFPVWGFCIHVHVHICIYVCVQQHGLGKTERSTYTYTKLYSGVSYPSGFPIIY